MTRISSSRGLLISEFARRCRLPISTLRYYDKIGLLTPSAVDPATGYRHYTVDQLASAVLIARLRAIGTAPGEIAEALTGGERAAAVFAAERLRLAQQIADGERALAELDDLVMHLDGRSAYNIDLVRLAREQVIAVPFHAAHSDLTSTVLRTIARLRHSLRTRAHPRGGPWGAAFPLRLTPQVRGFVFARTNPPPDRSERGTARLPTSRAARTTHHGGPATLGAAYIAMFDAIEKRGWTPTSPVIEEYLTLDSAPDRAPAIRLTVPLKNQPDADGETPASQPASLRRAP